MNCIIIIKKTKIISRVYLGIKVGNIGIQHMLRFSEYLQLFETSYPGNGSYGIRSFLVKLNTTVYDQLIIKLVTYHPC